MKNFYLLTVLFLSACFSNEVTTKLQPPVFHQEGTRALGWKKVLLPRKGTIEDARELSSGANKMMKIVGYVKVMEYRVSAEKSVHYFEVLNEHYKFMGTITDKGRVNQFETDSYSRKAIRKDLGEHVLEFGVSQLLNLTGEDKYLTVITDLKSEDTIVYQNYMNKKLKEEAANRKEIAATNEQAELTESEE